MTIKNKHVRRKRLLNQPQFAMLLGFSAALLGVPVQAALVIPSDTLQVGTSVPPNIMLILDDSTSMTREYMPDSVTSISPTTNSAIDKNKAYPRNPLSYNPAKTYGPWKNSAGDVAGGTSYTTRSVFTHTSLATEGSGTVNLSDNTQTFYVSKTGADSSNTADYYRYEIRKDGGNLHIVKSEYLARSGSSPSYNNGEANAGCTNTKNETWWRKCETVLPGGRDSLGAELTNYATWYSFHRTRMKVAKAGASEAFYGLGDNLRIGFTNIHNDSTSKMPIPVQTDEGRFAGANRTNWYAKLLGEDIGSGTHFTPLRTGLAAVGEYYKEQGETGPWGPGKDKDDQLACRQNFAILTTDGYWNKDDEEWADVAGYTSGNHDGTAGPNGYAPKEPYEDDYTDTLADIAMYYWKTDLRTDMNDIVRKSLTDTATWQHMVTFGISIGLVGTVSPSALPAVRSGAGSWPNPDPGTGDGNAYGIDDLLHAAVNSRGTFAVATSPDDFTKALRAALAKITGDVGSGSSVALTSTSVQDSTRAFAAKFQPGEWFGELEAFKVTNGGVTGSPLWSASKTVSKAERTNVYTLGGGGGEAVATFPTDDQKAVLTDAIAQYIKGNRSGETGTTPAYRTRTTLLGDIVNSSPAYVVEGDVETVYIGANDGMLHALDAKTGAERFNYVPNLIDMSLLKGLSVREDFAHRFFVDGPIVVSSRRQTPDKNYLVGTLGRGGKGVYGLDVTDPTKFSSTGKAWEYNGGNVDDDVDDMGLILSKPLIVKLNTGKWGAIVSNGVNSTNERAVLFVLDLETGAKIDKIETLTPAAPANNGLSAPTGVDIDGNGTVDYVYAGDLLGNVWKFDLSTEDVADWGVAGPDTPTPLFTAKIGDVVQPITGGVTVSFNPYTFDAWVFFGTGRFLTESDTTDKSTQSWYGIIDDGNAVARKDLKARDIVKGGSVGGRDVRAFELAVDGDMKDKRGWYIDLLTPAGTQEGERMVGNQVVAGGTVLLASSIIPESSACNPTGRGYVNAVDLFTGAALTTPFFDANNDNSFSLVDADGKPTDSLLDGSTPIAIGSVDLGVGMPTDPTVLENLVVVGGSKGTTGSIKIQRLVKDGRISWREILKD